MTTKTTKTTKTNDMTPLQRRLLMADMESFARSEGYNSFAEYDAAMTAWGEEWLATATEEEREAALAESYKS